MTTKTVDPEKDLAQRVTALEQRVQTLESNRPGRKAKPMLVLKQKGVCSLDPTRDSATCPDSSIFRYQSGCHGTACLAEQQAAYERRKNKKKPGTKEAVPQKKARAKK